MSFKKRLTIIISAVLGGIITLGTILFLIDSDISKKSLQIKTSRNDLNFRLNATQSLVILQQEFRQIQDKIYLLDNILPSRDDLVNFPKDLNALARNNNIILNMSLGQEGRDPGGKFGATNFTISGSGGLSNVSKFLNDLKSSRYSVNFNKLDFTREDNNFKILLGGQVFFF